jgi:acetamidase/formamidase
VEERILPHQHELPATPETVAWGYLDATLPPVLEIDSGDTVTVYCLPAGGPESFPSDGSLVGEDYRRVVKAVPKGSGGHILTGPVAARGAEPGDVLQIDILEVRLRQRWGYVSIMPLCGTLPEEFTDYETIHPVLDPERQVGLLPWGTELPLDPFFGVLATAPPPAWGRVTSNVPRAFGGNMDNKELKPGATLYLPVFNKGALFMAGDGHAVQGDGEVCVTAIETGLTGTFRLTVRKDLGWIWPFAETPTHLISIGLDEDLDDAAKQAVREMVVHVCRRTNLSRNQAYMLCSLAGELRVTQIVDGNKGCHLMLPRSAL